MWLSKSIGIYIIYSAKQLCYFFLKSKYVCESDYDLVV